MLTYNQVVIAVFHISVPGFEKPVLLNKFKQMLEILKKE